MLGFDAEPASICRKNMPESLFKFAALQALKNLHVAEFKLPLISQQNNARFLKDQPSISISAGSVMQFLTESDAALDIEIDGASALSAHSADLVRNSMFKADGASFAQGKSCRNGKEAWLASFSCH